MRSRSAGRSIRLVALALSLTPVAGAGEFEFAEALAACGYHDLAEEEFVRILHDASRSEEERVDANYGMCWIRALRAERIADPLDRVNAIHDALDGLRWFATNWPRAPRAVVARFQIGVLLRANAQALELLLAREVDARRRDGIRELARVSFDDAAARFEEIHDGTPPEFAPARRFEAGYLALESRWQAASLGMSAPHLERCVRDAEVLAAEADGQVLSWNVRVVQGMALAALGRVAEGVASLRTVTSIDPADVSPKLLPEMIALEARAHLGLIRALARDGRDEEARAAYVAFSTTWPGALDDAAGRGATFWVATATEATGDMGKAIGLYSLFTEELDLWGARAVARLEALHPTLRRSVEPRTWVRLARFRREQHETLTAIADLHGAIEAETTGREGSAELATAWDSLGECYFDLGLYVEAALAHETAFREAVRSGEGGYLTLEETTRISEIARRSAHSAFVSSRRAFWQTEDPVDRERVVRMRDAFLSRFPQSQEAESLRLDGDW